MDVKILCDLDGPGMILDPSWRDRQAHSIVQHKAKKMEIPLELSSNKYRELFYSQDAFYNAALIQHDELIPEALQQLDLLQQRYQHLHIITARPDFLEPATTARLRELGFLSLGIPIRYKLYALNDKETREQYIATETWKAHIVQNIASTCDLVIFADDEERNRNAVEALHLGNVAVCTSLAQCLALNISALDLVAMVKKAAELPIPRGETSRTIPFGKHRGKELKDIPDDYLQWMQDPEINPQGIIRGSINWSQYAAQELQRRSQAYQQEIAESPAIFSKLPPETFTGAIVKTLTRELVAVLRHEQNIDFSVEHIQRMMLKAGYALLPAMQCAPLIQWATQAALAGHRPGGVGSDLQLSLWNDMDEQGNFCEEPQSQRQVYW